MKKIIITSILSLLFFISHSDNLFFNELVINNNKPIDISYNIRILHDINTVFIIENYKVLKHYTILNTHTVGNITTIFIKNNSTYYYLSIYDNKVSFINLENYHFYVLK